MAEGDFKWQKGRALFIKGHLLGAKSQHGTFGQKGYGYVVKVQQRLIVAAIIHNTTLLIS